MSNRRSDGSDDPSLVERIKSLADAMHQTSITDLELTEHDLTITLRRQKLLVQPVAAPVVAAAARGGAPAELPPNPAEVSLAVMAPITGVFYSSSSPALPPFAQVGDTVQPGQVVCLVEAMKNFNEIKTDIGGTVVAIPPKNGQLVKKGDPLVRIKPF